MKTFLLHIALVLLLVPSYAQEEQETIYHARKYLDINIRAKEKCNERASKQQKKLLSKLKRKEGRFAKRLKRKNPGEYEQYKQNKLSYDSIGKIQKIDPTKTGKKATYATGKTIDSLKGVKQFLENKAHVTGEGTSATDCYDEKLSSLNQHTAHSDMVSKRIKDRTNYLNMLRGKDGKKIKGIKSINKQTFYSNLKVNNFKQMADKSSNAEQRSLEYLQGKQGFTESLDHISGNAKIPTNDMSLDDLEKMGFQTKRRMKEILTINSGGSLGQLQEGLGGQIEEYNDRLNKAKETKRTVKETKHSFRGLKHVDEPEFRVNPLRGLPFLKRIEHQYNWQTTRATHEGKPAIFNIGYMAGFRHTPKWSYGAGIATSIGLGQNWNNIKFTFEGIGWRTYMAWEWKYGIGVYVGYERMYKRTVFVAGASEVNEVFSETPHNKQHYSEALLIGLTKSYRINHKINGSIQVLFDAWWKEKGLKSPVILRFTTKSK